MRENRIKAQAQRQKNFEQDKNQEESATSTEEVTIAEEKIEEQEDADTGPSIETIEASRNFRYPLTISTDYPGRIIFTAIKVEGIDVAEKIGSAFGKLTSFLKSGQETSTVADEKVDETTKEEIEKTEKEAAASLFSYENNQGGEPYGSVTLPLQRDLRFSDNAQYETANLGVFGGMLESGLQGGSPFSGVTTSNGQLTSTVSSLAAQTVAKTAGEGLGAAIGSVKGAAGAIVGATALSNSFEGLSPAVKSASRISSAPNQRTLFQQVQIRSFAFTFKMIANNAQEAAEIKNIVKFFRQELYPEKISLGETDIPLAYKFPNMFEIEVKNRFNKDAAFKIQRCYLRDVQTSFNATANGMHKDGNFIEVDISLAFQEIVALDKNKVRNGY